MLDEEFKGDKLKIDESQLKVDESKTAALAFDDSTEPSEYKWSQSNATRYYDLFKATLEELKKASSAILKECGDLASMQARDKNDRQPINPKWVMKFIHSQPDVLTARALNDAPIKTWSILGDPDLNMENCVAKLRNLPKISAKA